jgi:predicted SAM-dependent methyltransferase
MPLAALAKRLLPAPFKRAVAVRLAARAWAGDRRDPLAAAFLCGAGLEIGALNDPLPVPAGVKVRYVDRASYDELRATYPQIKTIRRPEIVDDAEKLSSVSDCSQDFIIANQFLEHAQDTIGTIKNFLRVLKTGGVLFLALPDKRATFDYDRPVTEFSHLLRDHSEGPKWSERGHYREAMRHVVGLSDPEEIERHVEREIRETGHTHFHVWDQAALLSFAADLVRAAGLDVEVEACVANPERSESVIVLRKGARWRDRAAAELSLRQAREAYQARLNGQRGQRE